MSTPDVKLQAVLRSACPPSEEQRSRLTAFLEKKYQQSVELSWSEDKSILGGFRIERYLREQGEKLVARFDAASYVALTRAMDTHDVARGRGSYEEVLSTITAPVLVVGCASDVLYPLDEQRELARWIPNARLETLDSPQGHDAFLLETESVFRAVSDFRGRSARRSSPGESTVSCLEVSS